MQELARLREFFAHFVRTPYSAQGNTSPSQPELELLMEDFKKFGAEAGRIAPPPLPKKSVVYVCVWRLADYVRCMCVWRLATVSPMDTI